MTKQNILLMILDNCEKGKQTLEWAAKNAVWESLIIVMRCKEIPGQENWTKLKVIETLKEWIKPLNLSHVIYQAQIDPAQSGTFIVDLEKMYSPKTILLGIEYERQSSISKLMHGSCQKYLENHLKTPILDPFEIENTVYRRMQKSLLVCKQSIN